MGELPNTEQVGLAASSDHLGWERLAQILGASVKSNRHGEHLSVHCWFGSPASITPKPETVRLLAQEAGDDAADIERWLFFDTETTGTKCDTEMCPFLTGFAWWEGGGLEVEQLFMREAREECSVLAAIAERLEERPVLVTYNGKSFDWPLLKRRYGKARTIPLPRVAVHLDFLHAARNLWRSRLGCAKLSHLERHVLSFERGADIIANRIPRTYLEFVRWGNADGLIPVFHHNQMDLRGLAGVATRVLALLATTAPPREDLTCSARLAFVSAVDRPSARASCASYRSSPYCLRKSIGWRERRSPGWQSAKATLNRPAKSGEAQ